MKSFAKHLPHYMPLFGVLLAGLIGFWFFSYDRFFQFAVSIGVAVSYVTWGIIHHHLHRDLSLAVVIEYLVVASFGLVVIFSLIFRA